MEYNRSEVLQTGVLVWLDGCRAVHGKQDALEQPIDIRKEMRHHMPRRLNLSPILVVRLVGSGNEPMRAVDILELKRNGEQCVHGFGGVARKILPLLCILGQPLLQRLEFRSVCIIV